MSAQQLATEIENLIISNIEEFGIEIESLQSEIYSGVLGIIKKLEIDDHGYIKQTSANRKTMAEAESFIDGLLPGHTLTGIVSKYVALIPDIEKINSNYFNSISDQFAENRNFIKSLQQQAIESVESNLLQDGLTYQVTNPLMDIMNQNINSGGQFSGFIDQLQNYIKGNDGVEGRLLSYSKTYLRDTLFQYSRAYQQAVVNDLKLEFYYYSGGLIDKSRQFCQERAGNYYHQEEIESWARLDWKGKAAGTTSSSIFILLGGYNCAHSVIPVHKSIVPEDVITRNKKPATSSQ